MPIKIDVLTSTAELQAAQQVFLTAMVLPSLPVKSGAELDEPGRTLGAWIDGELIGTARSYTSRLVAPGGARLPHAAVTHVGVLPTHTRRGAAAALLRDQLIRIAERGEVVASLRATQGGIYERFGYGVAGSAARVEIDRHRARFRDTVPASGPVRLLDPADVWEVPAAIYARAPISRTGTIDRPAQWWRLQQLKRAPAYVAVHGEHGAEDGFVRYRDPAAEGGRSAQRSMVVDDLYAATDTAFRGLIRHLLAVDIVDSVTIHSAAPDTPLRDMVTDERAIRVTDVRDETWLRLVDVPTALSRRTYNPGPPVTLAVTDAILPANTGTYRISTDGATPVTAPADLSTDIATLAAAYLGGTSWRHLVLAGRAAEHRPGAAAAADLLFRVAEHPFSGTYF